MSISLSQVQDLQEHLLGVFERSAHHAGEVNEVLLSLCGALLWRKNPAEPFKVNTKEGAGGNVIWFKVDRTRYALLYSHEERVIKLLEGGRKGELIQSFTNATPTSEVARIFAGLGESVPELSAVRKVRREDRDPNAPKDPQIKAARQLAKAAKAQKAPKDPEVKAEAKAARVAAKGDTTVDAVASQDVKEARLQAKAAKVQARDAKVKAQREKRQATRAEDKAARLAAAEAAAQAAAEEAAAEAAAQATPAPAA
jgi:Integron cassette protein VCH_CASS1 chain